MKIDRLLGIVMILVGQKSVTAKALADHFCVSIRTIQRDIDTLSVSGIPITSSQGRNGGYELLQSYTIDKTFLKAEELHLLMDLLKGLSHIISAPDMLHLTDKVNALGEERPAIKGNLIRFDFMPWLPQQSFTDILETLSEAILSKRLVSIEYMNQKGESTQRILECYQLWLKNYAWYVYAFCREKQEFRIFKVNRIENLKPLEESFEPRVLEEKDPFGHLKSQLISLTLKFTYKAKGRLDDYFFKENIVYLEQFILVKTKYPEDQWLYQTLLSFGTEVEVLEPLSIRARMKEMAMEIVGKY